MHDCRKIEERLPDLVFGELSAEQRRQTLAEVDHCRHCRAEHLALLQTLTTFDEVSRAMMPGESYWNGYHGRLRVKLAAESPLSQPQRWLPLIRGSLARPTWALGFAGLLLLALLMWSWLGHPLAQAPQPQQATDKPSIAGPNDSRKDQDKVAGEVGGENREENSGKPEKPNPKQQQHSQPEGRLRAENRVRPKADKVVNRQAPQQAGNLAPNAVLTAVVDTETLRHFEKSQLLLRALRNADEQGFLEELAENLQRWRDLLFTTVLLRREAEVKGNLAVQQVLGDLEPLLLDIANLPQNASASDIRALRERLQKQEIIAVLQMYAARPTVAGASSD